MHTGLFRFILVKHFYGFEKKTEYVDVVHGCFVCGMWSRDAHLWPEVEQSSVEHKAQTRWSKSGESQEQMSTALNCTALHYDLLHWHNNILEAILGSFNMTWVVQWVLMPCLRSQRGVLDVVKREVPDSEPSHFLNHKPTVTGQRDSFRTCKEKHQNKQQFL